MGKEAWEWGGRHCRQAKDGNFHAPAGARATEWSSAKIILFHFMMEPRVK